MYAVRDLTALDYENCDNILADPLYKRLFCFDSLANLHLECCYACVRSEERRVGKECD